MSSVNLLPEDYIAWRKQKRASLLCAVLFAVVMIGVLSAAVVSQQSRQHTREVRDRVDQAYQDAQKLITQLQQLESWRGQMLKKAVLTASLQETVLRSYLLATVTKALPPGGSILKFELIAKHTKILRSPKGANTRYRRSSAKRGSRAEQLTRLETTITVTGLAGTDVEVAKFIAAMARERLMASVDLVYSQEKEIDKVIVREFQVTMRLRPDAQFIQMANVRADGDGALAAVRAHVGESR